MLVKKLRSVRYAWKGFRIAMREEFNFRVQLSLGACALFLGYWYSITTTEWLFVIGVSGMVLSAELFNTALEELCDMLKPTQDPHVGKIKDLAAAAVFISAVTACVTGLVIFLPHFFSL